MAVIGGEAQDGGIVGVGWQHWEYNKILVDGEQF